jgi:hypothetical protein
MRIEETEKFARNFGGELRVKRIAGIVRSRYKGLNVSCGKAI